MEDITTDLEHTPEMNVEHLYVEGKTIHLVGTAHVSKDSAILVGRVIEREKPDTVCVELCQSRFDTIREKKRWLEMDIIKVIREKKAFLLLSNLMLASFQRRIAEKFDIKPGEEMVQAIESAGKAGAQVHLADREIRVTLARVWRGMSLWGKIKLLFQLILSLGEVDEIDEADIEQMKQEDILQTLLADVEKSLPELRRILIDERDRYLAQKIKTAPGERIVAVVGAGHVPGIRKYIHEETELSQLETVPPKGKIVKTVQWLIPLVIVGLIGYGFFIGGAAKGKDMIYLWILLNGVLAGIGAIIAFGHPLTIVSSVLVAPLTSLNPMIAAGWVSGLVEAFSRKPKVIDFQNLSDDILSIKGFWKNKVTRVLLVVVFTNLGSSVGTFVAIPMLLKILH